MTFNFDEARAVLLKGVLEALKDREAAIRAIERTAGGELPVTSVSLDLSPWHEGGVGISLRVSSDPPDDYSRYSSVEWDHFDFASANNCPALATVAEYVRRLYQAAEDGPDCAHLIFLAGAEALLDHGVARFFRSLGVDAPTVGDRFVGHWFDYVVTDPDGSVVNNYCDIVLANRVTRRLLGP